MATRADVLETIRTEAPVAGKAIAADFGRLVGLALVLSLAVGLLLTAAAVAVAEPLACGETPLMSCERPADAQSGSFFMRRTRGEPWTRSPMLDTEVSVRVSGLVARARVAQRFRNASDEWVEGIYVFPLSPKSAVDHLRMRVGERTIEGQIREREQARAEYQRAAASGRKASLVEQERPNVFTTSVANLGPGEQLVVEIELQQTLDFDRGEVRLRFPLVVGPRHVPGWELVAGLAGIGWSPNSDQVEDASRVTPPALPPGERPRNPVRIDVELDAGFPIATLASRYHAIVSEAQEDGRLRVRLRDDLVPADRDFELAWAPRPGAMPRGSVFVEEREGSTFALLTLFPPLGPEVEASRLSREVVYVIDTSGSMEGASIQQARAALGLAIDRLRPGDRFNVIQFNSTTEVLFDVPRPATAKNQAKAKAWVLRPAAERALERPAADPARPQERGRCRAVGRAQGPLARRFDPGRGRSWGGARRDRRPRPRAPPGDPAHEPGGGGRDAHPTRGRGARIPGRAQQPAARLGLRAAVGCPATDRDARAAPRGNHARGARAGRPRACGKPGVPHEESRPSRREALRKRPGHRGSETDMGRRLTRSLVWGLGTAVVAVGAAAGHYTREVWRARAETPRLISQPLAAGNVTLLPEDLSGWQLTALLAVQDPTFFEHRGWAFGHGTMTTITQVLVKWYYFEDFQPGLAKVRQSLIARFALDPLVSKRDQLTLFINNVWLAKVDGRHVRGLAEGAQVFHGKRFQDLSNDEFLSLLVFDEPARLNVRVDPEGNARRVRQIRRLLAGQCRRAGLLGRKPNCWTEDR